MASESETYPVVWRPGRETIEGSNLVVYQKWLQRTMRLRFRSYQDLWSWSVQEPDAFWGSLWHYFNVIEHQPYKEILTVDPMPDTRWFPGAEVNLAEHIFRNRTEERPALLYASERDPKGTVHEMSWKEMELQVIAVQQFMKAAGVKKGDRVAAYLPNGPQATVIWLAAAGLGAVWSCCSPDFGIKTVLERFSQISPVIFFAAGASCYGGKTFSRLQEIEAIRQGLPGLRASVLVETGSIASEYVNDDAKSTQSGSEGKGSVTAWSNWNELLAVPVTSSLELEPVPSEHPLWVLYSSGTTGKPKPITHSHAGILMEHMKYLHLQNDVRPGEIFFWYTTTGWMMWNFLQGSMLVGAIPFLYDGSPAWPDLNRLWEYASALPIHHFGTSAPWLIASARAGGEPAKTHDLQELRSISSTGAPLTPEGFDWVYGHVKPDVWLCSMSGGTDVCTAFVGGCITEPVRRGLIQQRALGCHLAALDEQGREVYGKLGELAVLSPMPSMPVFFWGDESGERYRESYFHTYPGVWIHGDWIRLFKNGSLIIEGRSDATLNRGGVRIGTAEIYSIIGTHPDVSDSLMIYLEHPEEQGGGELILFVVPKSSPPSKFLGDDLRKLLREQGSPRHVPDQIHYVNEIPYTLSGKKMEVPIKKILKGENPADVLNRDAVRNPSSIESLIRFSEKYINNKSPKLQDQKPLRESFRES